MTLKAARERKKWTQEQLAEASGVTQGTISLLELGRTQTPTWDVVARLCKALDVEPEDVFPVDHIKRSDAVA